MVKLTKSQKKLIKFAEKIYADTQGINDISKMMENSNVSGNLNFLMKNLKVRQKKFKRPNKFSQNFKHSRKKYKYKLKK
jgi:hypothetical protein